VAEALLAQGDSDVAIHLQGDRVSPTMRRRIAEHPDPAIRDARSDFIRTMVDRQVPMPVTDVEDAYGRPRSVLIRDPDPKVRAALARGWRERPMQVQEQLLDDPDPIVRAAATLEEHPGVPAERRERCLADPATRANVARYMPLTADQIRRLLHEEDEDIVFAIAANPDLPAAALPIMAGAGNPALRLAAAYSNGVDAETRDQLITAVHAECAAGTMDADIALHWMSSEPAWLRQQPLPVRMSYLDCPHAVFRRVIASTRDLPDEAWQQLDNDPDVEVRRTAARRPSTPPDVLERLVRSHGDVHHIRPMLVEHPNFPRHRLHTFIDEASPAVRYLTQYDPDLPTETLRRLATDPQPSVRRGAARHRRLTPTLFDQLLTDNDPEVVDDAAANPTLPRDRMYRILTDANL
jgi:hypothetical protein